MTYGPADAANPSSAARVWPAVVRAADNLHIGVTRLDRSQHRAALVGRGIVDDDTFDIWIGLTEYGVDRGTQKTSVIEIDDDDTDQRQAKKIFLSPDSCPGKALHLARGLHRAFAQAKPIARSLIQMNASALRIESQRWPLPAKVTDI